MEQYELFETELPNGSLMAILRFCSSVSTECISNRIDAYAKQKFNGEPYSKFIEDNTNGRVILLITRINELDYTRIQLGNSESGN